MNLYELLAEHIDVSRRLEAVLPDARRLAERIVECIRSDGTVYLMGNGGSAADCQHIAAEFVGRFEVERRGYSAIALTTDTSVLTAIANDYGYDDLFARQVEALCRPRDVVIGLSTSGSSENVVRGLSTARAVGAFTAAFTGSGGGKLREIVEIGICVPSTRTARIQEAHILLGHLICYQVEQSLANEFITSETYV